MSLHMLLYIYVVYTAHIDITPASDLAVMVPFASFSHQFITVILFDLSAKLHAFARIPGFLTAGLLSRIGT